jgi:ABC-type phosphate transport system substrate-binding protein
VKGSSSTASITQYLNQVCPAEWPDTLVGKTINWKTNTVGCEGSGGMTDCISSTPGTIGYIDSGHGHAEGLQEIELKNADGIFVSSKQAADRGGIMAATENAGLPVSLDGSFAGVNLLNRVSAKRR